MRAKRPGGLAAVARLDVDHEDRHSSRVRPGARPLHVRKRVLHPLHGAGDPRRGLLQLPSVLHGPAEAGGHRRAHPPPQAPPGQVRLAPRVGQRPMAPEAPGGEGLWAQRDAPVGGQAVLEGVMMRGVSTWAVAVRKPLPEQLDGEGLDPEEAARGEIEVASPPLTSVMKRHRALRLPIVRGVVALVESMVIGFKALGISANAQLPEEEQEISGGMWFGTVVVALVLAIGLFFVVPVGLTSLIKDQLGSSLLFWPVEGILRTTIFLGYIALLSRLRDLRRVFEYHGAEHKTISCYEAGLALTPERAQGFSRLQPRCGSSFLLMVMIVAIVLFAPIGLPAWYWLVLSRFLG